VLKFEHLMRCSSLHSTNVC